MVRMLSAALALALLAPLAPAEEKDVKKTDRPVEKRQKKENPLDKDFLVEFHQLANNTENCLVVAGRLASSDKVKEFAKTAKKDHDELSKDLGTAIKDKKLAVVATPDKETVNKLNELRKKEKEEFDKAFLAHFIDCHERAIKMAEHQKAKGTDKDVTTFAEKALPVLKKHVKEAKDLQKNIK
jgi:putative membrane protein